MTAAESHEVHPDGVETLTCVRTGVVDDWRATVHLCGELDLANVGALRAELARHLDAGRRVLRVDATAVTFMDSVVIGALLEASQRCQLQRGSLILTGVSARLQRVLALAGLDQVLLVDSANR